MDGVNKGMKTVKLEEDFDYGAAPGTRLAGKVPPTTFANMDEPIQKVHKWYALLGTPTRDEMKAKIAKNPDYYGVTPDMVDLLPWNGSSQSTWSYEQKNTQQDNKEYDQRGMQDKIKKQQDETLRRQQEEARKRKEEDAAALEAERLRKLREKERKLEELKKKEMGRKDEEARKRKEEEERRRRKEEEDRRRKEEQLRKMKEEEERKRREAEEARKRKEDDDARKRLEKCIKDLTAFSKNFNPSNEKKELDNALVDAKDWLNATPVAKKEQYEAKQAHLEALAKKLKDAEEARRRKDAEEARKRLEKCIKDLTAFSKDFKPSNEKKNLDNALGDTKDWLKATPIADKEDYEEKQDKLEALAKKLKDAEDERRRREEEERRRREKEEADRKRREQEEAARNKNQGGGGDDEDARLRKLQNLIDSKSGKLDFEDEQKRKQFLRDTRLLMAYRWWYRFSTPNKKDMTRKVNVGDMKEADIYPEDVELLPWLHGGFTVDVQKMLAWINSLDPRVTETVEKIM